MRLPELTEPVDRALPVETEEALLLESPPCPVARFTAEGGIGEPVDPLQFVSIPLYFWDRIKHLVSEDELRSYLPNS